MFLIRIAQTKSRQVRTTHARCLSCKGGTLSLSPSRLTYEKLKAFSGPLLPVSLMRRLSQPSPLSSPSESCGTEEAVADSAASRVCGQAWVADRS